jgi:beta-glucosidase
MICPAGYSFSLGDFWSAIPDHTTTRPSSEGFCCDWEVKKLSIDIKAQSADRVDILFIGDSITEFWGMEGAGKSVWDEFYAGRYALNFGLDGDRTEGLLKRIMEGNFGFKKGVYPKLIVFMMGTNNLVGWETVVTNTPSQVADGIRANLQLIRRRLPSTRILLLGIFPRGAAHDDPVRALVNKANEMIAQYADGNIIQYLDIGASFMDAQGNLSTDIFHDGLHLTTAGYRIWAESIEGKVTEMLALDPLTPLRIMPLGNSITEGVSSYTCYRRYLDQALRLTGLQFDFVGSMSMHSGDSIPPETYDYDPDHEGHWGCEADWFLPRLEQYVTAADPDLVLLHAGTNDILHELDPIDRKTDRTVEDVGNMIDILHDLNPEIKIALAKVIPTIDTGLTDPEMEIQVYNAKLAETVPDWSTVASPIALVDQH